MATYPSLGHATSIQFSARPVSPTSPLPALVNVERAPSEFALLLQNASRGVVNYLSRLASMYTSHIAVAGVREERAAWSNLGGSRGPGGDCMSTSVAVSLLALNPRPHRAWIEG